MRQRTRKRVQRAATVSTKTAARPSRHAEEGAGSLPAARFLEPLPDSLKGATGTVSAPAGVTRRDVAKRLGVSPSAVRRLEAGGALHSLHREHASDVVVFAVDEVERLVAARFKGGAPGEPVTLAHETRQSGEPLLPLSDSDPLAMSAPQAASAAIEDLRRELQQRSSLHRQLGETVLRLGMRIENIETFLEEATAGSALPYVRRE